MEVKSSDPKKELIWFVIIVVAIGVIWIVSGGLKSATKNNPFIQPTADKNQGVSFFFPLSGNRASSTTPIIRNYSTSSSTKSSTTKTSTQSTSKSTKTIYGAGEIPGPIITIPDTVTISRVNKSSDTTGKAGNEYVKIAAPKTNKGKILITGMMLKSRMTGKQYSIGESATVYYANAINNVSPVFLAPGESAYVITRRSPVGYSFKENKCVGYLKSGSQNFVVSLPSVCPKISEYPLPAYPNAFNDKCYDFIKSIGSCSAPTKYPTDVGQSCVNFVAERANYTRCVTDFSNDKNFLGDEWYIYLGRDELTWKTKREIIDLLDQKGNVINTYTY